MSSLKIQQAKMEQDLTRLSLILIFTQFKSGKLVGQLQGLLDALRVSSCSLGRHVFPTSFSIQQRAHFLNPLTGLQTTVCNILQMNITFLFIIVDVKCLSGIIKV